MPTDSAPPRYSQHGSGDTLDDDCLSDVSGLQLLIVPALDGINFQKGYTGAEGEHAAMEGEVHLKDVQPGTWKKLSVSLRTTESAHGQEIELGFSEIEVASFPPDSFETIPTSFPFAIPLMPDVPQCVHTLHSSVMHILSATLHPVDPILSPISRELLVHTRRYTSHTHTVAISPEKHVMHDPVRVEAEIPKSTFIAGEPIPVYVTVPPPLRQLVLEGGLRLRNIKTELIRVVKVKSLDDLERKIQKSPQKRLADETSGSPLEGPSSAAFSSTAEKSNDSSRYTAAYTTIMSRSGASCRFHTSRPIRLRFVLHQASPSASPLRSLAEGDSAYMTNELHCVSITQTTLLHGVSFLLNVHSSFVDITSRTETLYTIPIPINIIPPPAPLPEVEEWVDTAYQKKHDRPPLRTVRQEDTEVCAPLYHEGEAGPSYTQNGAPPPFEDRDIPPPPFFPSEASTSAGLPTFQESENEIYIPADTEEHFTVAETVIVGEGVIFGFSSSQQFDGHTDPLDRTSTPPPPVGQVVQDPEFTDFVDISQPHRVLGLIEEPPPPPPPPLDDPSDPPPPIDSVFRSPTSAGSVQTHPSTSMSHHPFTHDHHSSHPGEVMDQGSSHAPPPYLTPNDQEQIARPPPYVDFIPPHDSVR